MATRTIEGIVMDTTRDPGVQAFAPIALNADDTRAKFTIHRRSWDAIRESEFCQLYIEISQDNGVTWEGLGGCGMGGGEILDRLGAVRLDSTVSMSLPGVSRTRRQIRGTFTQAERCQCKVDVRISV